MPFETISREAFEAIFPQLAYVQLTTTYRSSYEIALYTKKFLRSGNLQPIARHGKVPKELHYTGEVQMMELLHVQLQNHWKTTAIICKTEADVARIVENLTVPHYVLDGESETFASGVLVTTIQYAKGLEFDAVIVPYVDRARYATDFDKGLLYIATSRAMHELTVLVGEQPSPLL